MTTDVGDRLKAAREEAGHASCAAGAKAVGLSNSRYSKHENGDRTPGIEDCITYGRVFGINPGWIMFGDEFVPRYHLPGPGSNEMRPVVTGDLATVVGVERNGKTVKIVKSRGMSQDEESQMIGVLLELAKP